MTFQFKNNEMRKRKKLKINVYYCFTLSFYISNFFSEYIFATLPRTNRGQPIVLGGDPKGKNFLYTNGNSVIIRNIEVTFKKIF